MIYSAIPLENPFMGATPKFLIQPKMSSFRHSKPIYCLLHQNPDSTGKPRILVTPNQVNVVKKRNKIRLCERYRVFSCVGSRQMVILCGFGYLVQGFRCFPWLALNLHMANNLNLNPSTLQLVQNSANFPMVVKPLYGVFADAMYTGGAHRIPYISTGVLLQVLSWGPLALIPDAHKVFFSLVACGLLSNLGASITEFAKDALLAEYGQKHKVSGLQSYAFMALVAGGILGNVTGGYFLQKMSPRTMFLIFSSLLSLQLSISFSTREEYLGLPQLSVHNRGKKSISVDIRNQLSNLVMAISRESISSPLTWIVGSIAVVPILSGTIFCYQTQCLNLDPSIIGLSRVTGQLLLLSGTIFYNSYWKRVSMRKLIGMVQILYATSLFLDLVLVHRINLRLGISNELFALCFSGLAEALAQFKLLPFSVLLTSLCPQGCVGSLTSFVASAFCLSSIVSGLFGVGLASVLGITSGDYSGLSKGILIQVFAALVPLRWLHSIPISQPIVEKRKRRGTRRKNS